jgi:hypothetical protein
MVATVNIREKNGAGETATNKDGGTVRFKNADNATVDANDPLVIPTANTEYSFEKFLRMFIGATGPDNEITNLEFFMDGAKGWAAGVKLWGRSIAAYTTPAVPTETNDPPQIPVGGTPAAATDAFTWTTGAPLSLGAGPFSTVSTDMGNYVDLVLEVEIGSTQGTLTAETATFRYDES